MTSDFLMHTPDRTREGKAAVERRPRGEGFASNLDREGTAGIPAALVHRLSRPDGSPGINMRGDGTLGLSLSSSSFSLPRISIPDDVTTALIASHYCASTERCVVLGGLWECIAHTPRN